MTDDPGRSPITWDDVAEMHKLPGGEIAVTLMDGGTVVMLAQDVADMVRAAYPERADD